MGEGGFPRHLGPVVVSFDHSAASLLPLCEEDSVDPSPSSLLLWPCGSLPLCALKIGRLICRHFWTRAVRCKATLRVTQISLLVATPWAKGVFSGLFLAFLLAIKINFVLWHFLTLPLALESHLRLFCQSPFGDRVASPFLAQELS